MTWILVPLSSLLLTTGVWSEDAPVLKEIFTTSLMKELATGKENVIFSPVSMESALGIVAFGAKGETMNQVVTALGYNPSTAKQGLSEKQMRLNEKAKPGAIWQAANRIMAAPDLPVKPEYINEVSQAFPGVVVNNFDFESPEKTAGEVNGWVSEKTSQVIKELVQASDINPNTKLIVLNAVYFKGEWEHGFDPKKTRKECFFSEPGKCTMTNMMHTKEDFKYGYHNEMKAEIIEFPYKDQDYSMIVVLPDERNTNLTSLIANLDVDKIVNFIDEKKYKVEVHVTMPKFEIEFKKEMKIPLMRMGMKNIFSDAADLSGMISGLRASVDSVIHKAKITVDEKGTVAAAATAVLTDKIGIDPEILTVNNPFLFYIRNNEAGILFSGLITDLSNANQEDEQLVTTTVSYDEDNVETTISP